MLGNKCFVFSFVIVTISIVSAPKPFRPPLEFDDEMIKNPQHSFVFKKIFQNENLLLALVNSALNRDGSPGNSEITYVELLDNSLSTANIEERHIYLDLLCNTSLGEQIIVGIQRDPESCCLKQAAYYTSKLYSTQLDRCTQETETTTIEEQIPDNNLTKPITKNLKLDKKKSSRTRDVYCALTPVHFIAFCDFYVFKEDQRYVTTHIIVNKDTKENSIKEFSWTFIELVKMKKISNVSELTTPIQKFAYLLLFNSANKVYVEGLKKLADSDELIYDALNAANLATWTKKEREDYEKYQKFHYKIKSQLAGAWEEGWEEGMEEGRRKQWINSIKNMIKNKVSKNNISVYLGWTLQDTENFIADNKITL